MKLFHKRISAEDFGNIHFGYTGTAAGLPLVVLLHGSTGAHLSHGTDSWWPRQLLNEYKDHSMIRWGAKLFSRHGAYQANVWFRRGKS